ncbi:MAG: TetR/AcrR family transcriptional regulator [Syntrophomonadaceae bacterium]|nr:TetR/AcrR family transcriptional regulator [Syntrophomonadaceae bacterium]
MKSNIPQRIDLACRQLASRRGFYRLTVDELAREAGISKRTLYRYYRSKEAIIEATLDAFTTEVLADIDDLLLRENDPVLLLKSALELLADKGSFIINPASMYDLEKYYPQLWQKIDQLRIERIKQVIGLLSAQDPYLGLSSHINLPILTTIMTASIQAILNPAFILENQLTFEEAAGQLSQLLIKMLSPFESQPSR